MKAICIFRIFNYNDKTLTSPLMWMKEFCILRIFNYNLQYLNVQIFKYENKILYYTLCERERMRDRVFVP